MARGNKDVKQKVRDSAAKQNSDSYPANEIIKRETSAEETEEAREGIEEMSKARREKVGEVVFAGGVSQFKKRTGLLKKCSKLSTQI